MTAHKRRRCTSMLVRNRATRTVGVPQRKRSERGSNVGGAEFGGDCGWRRFGWEQKVACLARPSSANGPLPPRTLCLLSLPPRPIVERPSHASTRIDPAVRCEITLTCDKPSVSYECAFVQNGRFADRGSSMRRRRIESGVAIDFSRRSDRPPHA